MKLLVTLLLLAGVAHAEGRRVVTETSIEILGPIHFEGATARLHPGSSTQHMLDAVAAAFTGNPTILKVEVRAYGTDATAQRGLLGTQRARAIVMALVARGVDANRLVPRGFAGPRPGESSDPAFFILKRVQDDKPGLLQKP